MECKNITLDNRFEPNLKHYKVVKVCKLNNEECRGTENTCVKFEAMPEKKSEAQRMEWDEEETEKVVAKEDKVEETESLDEGPEEEGEEEELATD